MTREECMEKLAEELKGIKGSELTYVCDYMNGDLAGNELYAYIAQADLEKGITIRGNLPKEFFNAYGINPDTNPDGDVVLQCCRSLGNPDDSTYLRYVLHYMEAAEKGRFVMSDTDNSKGGSATDMEGVCAFS